MSELKSLVILNYLLLVFREMGPKSTRATEFLLRLRIHDRGGLTRYQRIDRRLGNGDEQALDALASAVYPELRRIARNHLGRRRAGQTLESAAMANEAYLKLVKAGAIQCESRVHFLALCSQIIRRILVDHARARGYAKRGGDRERVPLDEAILGAQARGIKILALHEALESLARLDARKARVVELRYFGGLSVEETAEVLGLTPVRVKRDWKAAKTWLYGVLTREREQNRAGV